MFGRATITLGIGPHSSIYLRCTVGFTITDQLGKFCILLREESLVIDVGC